ncbi:MAG: 30S ribosomal protein S6 [Bacilli bacterium]
MKKYELMYILRPSLDDDARKTLIASLHNILATNGAKVGKVNEWGLRELAYEIKKETKGYYVVVKFEGDEKAINEFNRLVLINTNVLRHLVTIDQE